LKNIFKKDIFEMNLISGLPKMSLEFCNAWNPSNLRPQIAIGKIGNNLPSSFSKPKIRKFYTISFF